MLLVEERGEPGSHDETVLSPFLKEVKERLNIMQMYSKQTHAAEGVINRLVGVGYVASKKSYERHYLVLTNSD